MVIQLGHGDLARNTVGGRLRSQHPWTDPVAQQDIHEASLGHRGAPKHYDQGPDIGWLDKAHSWQAIGPDGGSQDQRPVGRGPGSQDRSRNVRWAVPTGNGGLSQRWRPAEQPTVEPALGHPCEQHGGRRAPRHALKAPSALRRGAPQQHVDGCASRGSQVGATQMGRRLSPRGKARRFLHDDLPNSPWADKAER